MPDFKVLIVGAGPSGASTALALTLTNHVKPQDVALIDAQQMPRKKVCGGGLTTSAQRILARLQTSVTQTHIVNQVQVKTSSSYRVREKAGIIKIVSREVFDAELVQHAQDRGVTVLLGERVVRCTRKNDIWLVETTARRVSCEVLVCAEGASRSISSTLCRSEPRRMMGLECISTGEREADDTVRISFDIVMGFAGYAWDFPVLNDCGSTVSLLGVGVSDILGTYPVRTLKSKLHELNGHNTLRDAQLVAAPSRWFSSSDLHSNKNMLVVGDAAGIDSFLAEGITAALLYGEIAGRAIADAIAAKVDAGRLYEGRIQQSSMGRMFDFRNRQCQRIYARQPMMRDLLLDWLAFRWWGVARG